LQRKKIKLIVEHLKRYDYDEEDNDPGSIADDSSNGQGNELRSGTQRSPLPDRQDGLRTEPDRRSV
jgi:hypothetical protein